MSKEDKKNKAFEKPDWPAPEPLTLGPARANTEAVMDRLDPLMIIDGQRLASQSGQSFGVLNPATEQELASVPLAGGEDVHMAIASARRSRSHGWGTLSASERGRLLAGLAKALQEQRERLATLESLDTGRPLAWIQQDLDDGIALVWHYAGWADKVEDRFPGGLSHPGVSAVLPSADAPVLAALRSLLPSLVLGIPAVVLPPPLAPLSVLELASLLRDLQWPGGAFNAITGSVDTWSALVSHDDVGWISFEGSRQAWRAAVQQRHAAQQRRIMRHRQQAVAMVLADADLPQVAAALTNQLARSTGQALESIVHVFVQEAAAARFEEALRHALSVLRVGDPVDINTDLGPMIDRTSCQRFEELLTVAENEGLKAWRPAMDLPGSGFYAAPALISDVPAASEIAHRHTTGPLLLLRTFRTLDEGVGRVNGYSRAGTLHLWGDKSAALIDVSEQSAAAQILVNGAGRMQPDTPGSDQRLRDFVGRAS